MSGMAVSVDGVDGCRAAGADLVPWSRQAARRGGIGGDGIGAIVGTYSPGRRDKQRLRVCAARVSRQLCGNRDPAREAVQTQFRTRCATVAGGGFGGGPLALVHKVTTRCAVGLSARPCAIRRKPRPHAVGRDFQVFPTAWGPDPDSRERVVSQEVPLHEALADHPTGSPRSGKSHRWYAGPTRSRLTCDMASAQTIAPVG